MGATIGGAAAPVLPIAVRGLPWPGPGSRRQRCPGSPFIDGVGTVGTEGDDEPLRLGVEAPRQSQNVAVTVTAPGAPDVPVPLHLAARLPCTW